MNPAVPDARIRAVPDRSLPQVPAHGEIRYRYGPGFVFEVGRISVKSFYGAKLLYRASGSFSGAPEVRTRLVSVSPAPSGGRPSAP